MSLLEVLQRCPFRCHFLIESLSFKCILSRSLQKCHFSWSIRSTIVTVQGTEVNGFFYHWRFAFLFNKRHCTIEVGVVVTKYFWHMVFATISVFLVNCYKWSCLEPVVQSRLLQMFRFVLSALCMFLREKYADSSDVPLLLLVIEVLRNEDFACLSSCQKWNITVFFLPQIEHI